MRLALLRKQLQPSESTLLNMAINFSFVSEALSDSTHIVGFLLKSFSDMTCLLFELYHILIQFQLSDLQYLCKG